MTWSETLFGILSGDAGVTALVSNRIGPKFFRQDIAKPYITFDLVGALPANNLSDAPTLDERRIQINCIAETYEQAVDIADAVRLALEATGHLSLEIDLPRDFDSQTYGIAQDWVIFFSRS